MLKSTTVIRGLLLCVLSVAGCKHDDTAVANELANINKQLTELTALVKANGAGAPRERPRPQRPRPTSTDVYSVPVAGAPFKGPKNAKVTIVKAFEFACPFCQRAIPTMDQLLKDYENDVRVVYKHYVVHPQSATLPAQASCAAGLQGKWQEMEAAIWDKAFKARDFSKKNLDTIATSVGLDMDKYNADMSGPCVKRVKDDQAQLAAVGTTGTPAFYINGRFLSGAQPIARFKTIVDEELKKANERIAKDPATTVSNYYDTQVLSKGKKSL